jgi:hypothetical protein
MSGRPDGRIEKGQRIGSAISARAWNRAQDAADIVLGVRPGVSADGYVGHDRPYNWVYVYNNTGFSTYDIPRWGPVWLNAGLRNNFYNSNVDTTDNEKFFQEVPVLNGVPATYQGGPTDSNLPVPFGIAVEPIKFGAIGKVAVSGVVQCKLNITSQSDTHANVIGATDQELKTGRSGEALILHKDAGTGSGKWGLIRLGTDRSMRRATITSRWNYGTSKTLTDDDGSTFSAVNNCQDLIVPLVIGQVQVLTERYVYCAFVAGGWHLVAWQNYLTQPGQWPTVIDNRSIPV